MTEFFQSTFDRPEQIQPDPFPSLDPRGEEPPGDALSFGDVAGDLFFAPVRGLEGAAQGIFNLADSTAEFFGGDLGSYDERFTGRSKTLVGGAIEGIAQFFVGFLPAVGVLSKAGKLSKAAQVAAKAGGSAKKAKAIELARFSAAGAVADATVFDAHEGRLSDLLTQVPALENPLTAFLASDPDDSEALGRFKNAVEGLGLGLGIDMLIPAARAVARYRKELGAGASKESASQAAQETFLETDLDRALTGQNEQEVPEGPLTAAQADDAIEEGTRRVAAEEAEAAAAQEAAEKFPTATGQAPKPTDDIVPQTLREIGVDEAGAAELWDKVLRRNEKEWPADINPRARVRNEVTGEMELKYSDADLVALELNRGDLNLSRFGDLDGTQLIRVLEGTYNKIYDRDLKLGQRVSLTEVEENALREVAGAVGSSEDALMAYVSGGADLAAATKQINVRIQAYRTALHALSMKAVESMRKARSVTGSAADRAEAIQTLRVLTEATGQMKVLSAEQSRILGNNRARIPGADFAETLDASKIADLVEGAGSNRHIDKLFDQYLQLIKEDGSVDIEALVPMTTGTVGQRYLRALNEVFVQSVVSGGKTFSVNTIGGVATAVYRPMELMLGAALTRNSGEFNLAAREFGSILHGLTVGLPEALRLGKAAFNADDSLLTSGRNTLLDPGLKQPAVNRSLLPPKLRNTVVGSGLDWIGRNVVRIPTRLLGGADEALKILTYRASTHTALLREAMAQGHDASWVSDQMAKMIWNGQAYNAERLLQEGLADAKRLGIEDVVAARDHALRYRDENFDETLSSISDYALDQAAKNTFTERLEKGSLGRSVQDFLDVHPLFRPIAPFVRTPTNLIKFIGRRVDVIGLGQLGLAGDSPAAIARLEESRRLLVKDLHSGDARARADAIGRLSAGAMMLSSAHIAAANGVITGGGPSDHEQRRLLEQAGWQPYSIKTSEGYVQFHRLDPFASFLGLMADFTEYVKWAPPEEKGRIEGLSASILTALTKNITEKSYFTGIANFIEAVGAPDQRLPKLQQRYAGAFVPNILGQSVTPHFDDELRQAHTVLEAVRKKIPGLSDDLSPYRNILGEPVHRQKAWGSNKLPILDSFLPFAYRQTNDNVVDRELADLGHGFTPPHHIRGDLNLFDYRSRSGQTAYDRWGELQGSVKLGGRDLRDALRSLFRTNRYKRMPEPFALEGLESPRIAEVNKVINRYRRESYRQVLREFPELRTAVQDRHERRRAARLGLLRR